MYDFHPDTPIIMQINGIVSNWTDILKFANVNLFE